MDSLIGHRKNLLVLIFIIIAFAGGVFFIKKYFYSNYNNYNIIVISLTSLRPDHLSFNNYERFTSPNIDELAKQSLIFRNAYSVSSWTLPSGISLFTGLYPFSHEVMNRHDGSYLNEKIPTLMDRLEKAGYETAAFTGGFDYDPIFGLTNRFKKNFYSAPMSSGKWGITDYDNNFGKIASSTQKAIDWLRANQNSKPFFLFVQGYDTHCPFTPKEGGKIFDPTYENKKNIDFSGCIQTRRGSQSKEVNSEKVWQVFSVAKIGEQPNALFLTERDVMHLIALYDEEIYEADKSVGNILRTINELGLSQNTIIILLAEHGDYLGEHGQFMRGGSIRGTFGEEAMRIPLIISIPDARPKIFDQFVSIVDIAPTIADILGINFKTAQGISFYPLIKGSKKKTREAVYGGLFLNPVLIISFLKKNPLPKWLERGTGN